MRLSDLYSEKPRLTIQMKALGDKLEYARHKANVLRALAEDDRPLFVKSKFKNYVIERMTKKKDDEA